MHEAKNAERRYNPIGRNVNVDQFAILDLRGNGVMSISKPIRTCGEEPARRFSACTFTVAPPSAGATCAM
jgi:hypothetical protein